ncbi:MAG: type III-A CRISPR-associated RAMP protein Csm5 [Desulfurococcaceae archaeon]
MRLKTEFALAIQVLTPVHIGTGHVLEQDFDFVVHAGQTLRIHEERFVEWVATRGEAFARLSQGVPPGQLLEPVLSSRLDLFRYVLPGVPKGTREIRECLKDAQDRPYLPGSALKGALRTVLLWRVWREKGFRLADVRVERAPKFAAQPLERKAFGETPHEDLLRALRLADSLPASEGALTLANVRCVSRSAQEGIPLALEVIKPNTFFRMEGHIDETAFKPWGGWTVKRNKNPFLAEEKRAWLRWDGIAQAARDKAKKRLERDLAWANAAGLDPKPWNDLLLWIRRAESGELKGFPLQIGFGTGWLGTTLGPALLEDPDFRRFYENYGLGKNPRTRRQTPLERFPASRRVVCYDTTCQPLGWIWVIPREEA